MTSPQISFDTAARPGMPRTLGMTRALVDVNLPSKCARSVDMPFAEVDALQLLGKEHLSDREVWDMATENQYDFILTRDQNTKRGVNLGYIAARHSVRMIQAAVKDHINTQDIRDPLVQKNLFSTLAQEVQKGGSIRAELVRLPLVICINVGRQNGVNDFVGALQTYQDILAQSLIDRTAYGLKITPGGYHMCRPSYEDQLRQAINAEIGSHGYIYAQNRFHRAQWAGAARSLTCM